MKYAGKIKIGRILLIAAIFGIGGCLEESTDDQASAFANPTQPPVTPGTNGAPVAIISNTPIVGVTTTPTQVDATQSNDDGSIVSYEWNWGDGNTSEGEVTSHAYAQPGVYTLTLTVTDNEGATSAASTTVSIADNGTANSSFSVSSTSGVIPLLVNFSASQQPEVQEYRWDFGDGTTGSGPTPTHTYVDAGTYVVILTATLNDGTRYNAQRRIDAFASINNTDAIVPGTALFFDSFEYQADRDDPGVVGIFMNHGWTGVKTQQAHDRNPKGYLYTTDTIPGYSGGMLPGAGSNRVLAMEALPTTLGDYSGPGTFWGDMQTDFYLQLGEVNAAAGTIPADVWFQFWLYTTGGITGGFDRSLKFLYPCNAEYPCQTQTWLGALGSTSQNPHWVEMSNDGEPVPDVFLQMLANDSAWTPGNWAGYRMGHTDTSEMIRGGRWVLVRMHIDTSGPQGTFEAWLRPLGGREVKVSENIGGVTPGFEWPLSDNSGHRVMRMPTTIGSQNVVDLYPQSYDVTFYLDDFTMATSEDDLPRYPY